MTAFGDLARRIDTERLWRRHEELAAFGATARGGVDRQALSDAEIAARRQLLVWSRPLGLVPYQDPAGNFFLRYPGRSNDLPPLLCGSHIDSQPTGGKYDGVFGVLAALEAIEAMRDAGFVPARPIEIVAWMNEEGSRFAPGMMGSEAFAGVRSLDAIKAVRDADGVTVDAELKKMIAAFPDVEIRPVGFPAFAFVEAHIEQGPILDAARIPVGVVTGIQGKKTFQVTVRGEEAHAGTTPMRERKDAVRAAAALIDALYRAADDAHDITRFTVGRVVVEPNAPSVVPATVTFSIDLRHPDKDVLTAQGRAVAAVCSGFAGPCNVELKALVDAAPLTFSQPLQELIQSTVDRLGIAATAIASAAGHDARNLHQVCPTAMIFVPCKDGISHNEAEATQPDDLAAGARVLAEVLAQLTGEGLPQ